MNLHPEKDIIVKLIAKDERSQIFDFIFSNEAIAACPEDTIPYPADKIRIVRERFGQPVSSTCYGRLIITADVFEKPVRITFDYDSGCTYIDDKSVTTPRFNPFFSNDHPLLQYKSFFDHPGFQAHLCFMHGLMPEEAWVQAECSTNNLNKFKLLVLNNMFQDYPQVLFNLIAEEAQGGTFDHNTLLTQLHDYKHIDTLLSMRGIYPSPRIKKILFSNQELLEAVLNITSAVRPFLFTSEILQYKFFSLDNAASILAYICWSAKDAWHTAFQVCGEAKMLAAFQEGLDYKKLSMINWPDLYAVATQTRYDFWGNDHLTYPFTHSTQLLSEHTNKSVTTILASFRYYCFEEMIGPNVLETHIHLSCIERAFEFESDRFEYRFPNTPKELIDAGTTYCQNTLFYGLENCLVLQRTEKLRVGFSTTKCLFVYDKNHNNERIGYVLFTPWGKSCIRFMSKDAERKGIDVVCRKEIPYYNRKDIRDLIEQIEADITVQIEKVANTPTQYLEPKEDERSVYERGSWLLNCKPWDFDNTENEIAKTRINLKPIYVLNIVWHTTLYVANENERSNLPTYTNSVERLVPWKYHDMSAIVGFEKKESIYSKLDILRFNDFISTTQSVIKTNGFEMLDEEIDYDNPGTYISRWRPVVRFGNPSDFIFECRYRIEDQIIVNKDKAATTQDRTTRSYTVGYLNTPNLVQHAINADKAFEEIRAGKYSLLTKLDQS